jgi:hypothetical protein
VEGLPALDQRSLLTGLAVSRDRYTGRSKAPNRDMPSICCNGRKILRKNSNGRWTTSVDAMAACGFLKETLLNAENETTRGCPTALPRFPFETCDGCLRRYSALVGDGKRKKRPLMGFRPPLVNTYAGAKVSTRSEWL